MAAGGENTGDFYAVLGLKNECSEAELRNAYKKLALRWHPDRCSASGNSKFMEEAKEKFQAIQQAYSVLSDSNKRFLYDVGLYDNDDDENGMDDFLGEMAQMMSQTNPGESGHESLEDLQQLFVDMFQTDLDEGFGGSTASVDRATSTSSSSSSNSTTFSKGDNCSTKRGCSVMHSAGKGNLDELDTGPGGFCFGSNNSRDPLKGSGGGHSQRRSGRQQKVSSKHDVSSCNAGIFF